MSDIQRFKLIAAVLVLVVAIAMARTSSAQTPNTELQSLTGTVKCAAQVSGHYKCARNQTLLTCTLACVAQGSSFVLQTGDKSYFLTGDQSLLEQLAGGKAILTGQIIGSTLAVNKRSDHISSPAMAGK